MSELSSSAAANVTPRVGIAVADIVIAAVCMAGVLLTGWWAFMNPSGTLPNAVRASHDAHAGFEEEDAGGPGDGTASAAHLDLAAFRAPLWVAPPAPTAPTPPAPTSSAPKPLPPPPPLKWQLLAIIAEQREGDVAHAGFSPRAMLYDPETDAILELAAGDRHAGRSVESITRDGITIRTGTHTHTLTLERPTTTAGNGGNSR
jgi:hypothetical protein